MNKESKEERELRKQMYISRVTSHFDTPKLRKEAEEKFEKENPQ